MVVSADIIKTNRFFHVTWILATGDPRKVSRREVLGQKVSNICDSIMEMVPEQNGSYQNKAGLYLLSLLTYGTVLVHRVQVDFLQRDVEKLKELLKKKSFVMLMAEKFDRDQEEKRRKERGNKLRSQPISSVEEIDSWINLADLNMISESIGINRDIREITMLDALPNIGWTELNADSTGLYGTVDQFSSHNNNTMYSTFVEGNGSDQRERKSDAVLLDSEEFVTPLTLPVEKKFVHDEPRKRSSLSLEQNRPLEDIEQHERPNQNEPVIEKASESLKHAKCFLLSPFKGNEPKPTLDAAQEDFQQFNKHKNSVLLEQQQQTESAQELREKSPQEALPPHEQALVPPTEELDLENVPRAMQDQVAAFFEQITNVPEESIVLPPPLQVEVDLDPIEQPPQKKQKIMDEVEETALEEARRRASSRPVTPLNQSEWTNLQTTIGPEEQSFQLDSQIRDPLPQRKKPRRNLPPIYGDDLEIDVSVQKALLADWSSLVRKKEDVMVKLTSKSDAVSVEMFNPYPAFGLGNCIAKEVRDAFHSGVYRYYTETEADNKNRNDDASEDQLRYATVCLAPPEDTQLQPTEEEQRTRMFEEEYRPPQFEEPSRLAVDVLDVPLSHERMDEELRYAQTCLRPSTPLEIEQNRHETTNETLKFANASLLPNLSEEIKFASAYLLPTPEKVSEERITEELQLEPFPIGNNIETLDYSNRRLTMQQADDSSHTFRTEGNLENPRRHHKSSLGIRANGVEQLKEATREERFRDSAFHQERMQFNVDEQDPFVFSSGSLLPNNRFLIHEELLTEAKRSYPDWIDFNQFTSQFTRKKAATSFEGLLLGLKNMKLCAKQEHSFGTILVQHVEEDLFDETQQ